MSLLPEGVVIKQPNKLYIGGQWVDAVNGGVIELISPDTEAVVAQVAEASEADVDAVVAAAKCAFEQGEWTKTTPQQRGDYVRAMAQALAKREPEIAKAWSAQMGGLQSSAPFMVAGGTQTFNAVADLASTFKFEQSVPTTAAQAAMLTYEPVGVVAAIAPWNAPYAIMAGKVANALLAGCTVIMKPSPETPLEAYIMAEVAEEVGLPAGALNLITAHRDVSDYLVRHEQVDKVAFTGSTVAGRRIASVCGDRIARCSLELGGKSAAILLDDYATDEAAQFFSNIICMMSGQICAMISRVFVPKAKHDELAAMIAEQMEDVKIGYSDDPETQMGPVAMKRQLERIEHYIALGVKEGARLVTGGRRPNYLDTGYFIEPTLFSNVDNQSTIAQEEIFGPVLCLIPYDDVDHAIEMANDTIYGLNSAVVTNDVDQAYQVARRLRTGTSTQNGLSIDVTLPMGGFKQSGLGREGGQEGLLSYLESHVYFLQGQPKF